MTMKQVSEFKAENTCSAFQDTLLKERQEAKVTGRRRRRSAQLLEGLKKQKGYCKLQEAALDRTLRRTRFGNGYGPVEGHITE